jgi:hypothetical protein
MPTTGHPTTLVAKAILNKRKRVVVIAGAGASEDSGIPTGKDVGQHLSHDESSIVRHELGEPESWNFFQVVDVLGRTLGEEKVQERLQQILRPRFLSLGYEILAHYLHRKEIHAVISLNHDQAFDQSLDLESSGFPWQARSHSEFDALLDEIRESGDLPAAYLKVHGCVSRKITVRMDRGSVGRLEKEKLTVLEKYLEAADVILCLGWSMHDPDVVGPLARVRRMNNNSDLIVVNSNPGPTLSGLVEGLNGKLCHCNASDFLSEVGDTVEGKRYQASGGKRGGTHAVGLHRHRIRAICFGRSGCLCADDAEAQAALEVIMFALKARAQIEPRILFECSRTARLLARSGNGARHPTRSNTKREKISGESAQVQCLARILTNLCEQRIFSAKNDTFGSVYWLSSAGNSNPGGDLSKRIACELTDNLLASRYARAKSKPDPNLTDHFRALTRAFDVDLIPRASDFAMFAKPDMILTKEDFDRRTRELLSHRHSKIRLCVSTNTGEWIATYGSSLKSGHIARCKMIVEDLESVSNINPFRAIAERRRKQALRALKSKGIETELKVARNKTHQLTAIFTMSGQCKGAIYFRREGKSTRISPVWLTDAQDLKLVGRMWGQLWADAKRYSGLAGERSLT